MRHGTPVILLLFTFHCIAQTLPAGVQMTPVKKADLIQVDVFVPQQFKSTFTQRRVLKIPAGYTAKVFYAGRLSKPRFFDWSPDSVLHVANKTSGEIIALPDRNHKGAADTAIVVASGFNLSHDLAFYNGAMYVAEERRVVKVYRPGCRRGVSHENR